MNKEIEILKKFVTEQRLERFYEVLENRTRYMTVVLEDLYQPHNASAVLRSCDIMGIQDVHIIENENKYVVNKEIAVGASQWLTLKNYNNKQNNTLDAIKELKKQGYRIVATSPHRDDVELKEFDLSKGKAALVFGSEKPGISDIVIENADEFLKIDMYGFTESFNISVSVALIINNLVERLHQTDINWKLTEGEKKEILLTWLKNLLRIQIIF